MQYWNFMPSHNLENLHGMNFQTMKVKIFASYSNLFKECCFECFAIFNDVRIEREKLNKKNNPK